MKQLEEIRQELDALDREMVRLFEQRMGLARQVAEYKLAHGLPVLDASREAQVLASRAAMLQEPRLESSVRALFEEIMRLSRQEQQRMLEEAENHA